MERNQILIFFKDLASSAPTVLFLYNSDTINNPYDFTNTFNNFSTSTTETKKKKNIHINIFQTIFQIKVVV